MYNQKRYRKFSGNEKETTQTALRILEVNYSETAKDCFCFEQKYEVPKVEISFQISFIFMCKYTCYKLYLYGLKPAAKEWHAQNSHFFGFENVLTTCTIFSTKNGYFQGSLAKMKCHELSNSTYFKGLIFPTIGTFI